jgi:hypothetical protein
MKIFLQSAWRWISGFLGKLPFIGHFLTKCSAKDFWTAGIEYLNLIVWSTMPFWLGTGLLYVQAANTQSLDQVFQSTFKNGELFVYTISTLTPITYLTLFEDPKGRFPHRLGIGTLAFMMIICCACLFALQKASVSTKGEVLYYGSIYFAFAAVFLRYLAVLYNKTKLPANNEQDFVKSTDNLISKFDDAVDKLDVNSQGVVMPARNTDDFDDVLAKADAQCQPDTPQGGR